MDEELTYRSAFLIRLVNISHSPLDAVQCFLLCISLHINISKYDLHKGINAL